MLTDVETDGNTNKILTDRLTIQLTNRQADGKTDNR